MKDHLGKVTYTVQSKQDVRSLIHH